MSPKQIIKLGVLGGGQLARMMLTETTDLAQLVSISVLSEEQSPAALLPECLLHQKGSYNNLEDLQKFCCALNYLTIEIEHVDVPLLRSIAAQFPSLHLYPTLNTIETIQNKFTQKQFLEKNGIPIGEYALVDMSSPTTSISHIASLFGYPLMLKSSTYSYDGKGNYLLRQECDIPVAIEALSTPHLYAEKLVNFTKEVSVMVARDLKGKCVTYEPTLTIQSDSICVVTVSPCPDLSSNTREICIKNATDAVNALDGVGIFGVEMFVLNDGRVYVNEIACRPHNSGHWTIGACSTNQFKQHILCVSGFNVDTNVAMQHGCVGMINIIGKETLELHNKEMLKYDDKRGVLNLYDKAWRKGRKLGHFNVFGTLEYVEAVIKDISGFHIQ